MVATQLNIFKDSMSYDLKGGVSDLLIQLHSTMSLKDAFKFDLIKLLINRKKHKGRSK